MAVATRLSRSAIKSRLRDVLEGASGLAGVTVTYSAPTEPMVGANVFLSDVRGVLTVANQRAGSLAYDDVCTVDVVAAAWNPGDPDHEQSDIDVEDLVEAIRVELAAHPFLDDLDGNPLPGVVHAVLSDLDGPTPWRTSEGCGSAMRLSVEVHTRIT
jgi:hypothetical protein